MTKGSAESIRYWAAVFLCLAWFVFLLFSLVGVWLVLGDIEEKGAGMSVGLRRMVPVILVWVAANLAFLAAILLTLRAPRAVVRPASSATDLMNP